MRNAVLNRKKPPSPSPAVHQLTLLLLVATSATFLLHKLANVFFSTFHLKHYPFRGCAGRKIPGNAIPHLMAQ